MKRYKRILNEPANPLFIKWLNEWKDQAVENNNDHLQFLYNRALKSLKRYPFPLDSGAECIILENFGKKLCDMLDKKLKDYKMGYTEEEWKNRRLTSVKSITMTTGQSSAKTLSSATHKLSPIREEPKSSNKEYMPKYRSGGYAILISLQKGSLTKNEIQINAQDLCDTSFTKPSPGSHYTAWSSMTTLIKKGLVVKSGKPVRFTLTDSGKQVAEKIQNCNLNTSSNDIFIGNTESLEDLPNKGVTNSEESEGNERLSTETIFLLPGTFDVILLIDCQETDSQKNSEDLTTSSLKSYDILVEVRKLNVGDFLWIAKDKTTSCELVLPYIVERKRMDDFAASIKDGRFYEQKFRLKGCGVKNLIYMVEKFGKDNQRLGLPLGTLHQAAINTQIVDEFTVKFTRDHSDSMRYLACLTKTIFHLFKDKTLMSCNKADLISTNLKDELMGLMVFKDFNKAASKVKKLTVKDMLLKQLIQLKGLSVDKALAITDRYPTPKKLIAALNEPDGEKSIAAITYGSVRRMIGPVLAKSLHQFYTFEKFP